jgi:hypothetical protein
LAVLFNEFGILFDWVIALNLADTGLWQLIDRGACGLLMKKVKVH